MCTSFETLCFACLYKSLKIVNFVFLHFLSACRLCLFSLENSSLIDSNHEEELFNYEEIMKKSLLPSAEKGVHDYLVQYAKSHSTGSPFQHMKTETLESSAINYGRSILAMFQTVLYAVEGLEIETLK